MTRNRRWQCRFPLETVYGRREGEARINLLDRILKDGKKGGGGLDADEDGKRLELCLSALVGVSVSVSVCRCRSPRPKKLSVLYVQGAQFPGFRTKLVVGEGHRVRVSH